MALADYLSSVAEFEAKLKSCEEFLGEGQLLIAPLAGCDNYPTIYEVEVATAIALNAVSASLQLNSPLTSSYYLYKGDVLSFEVTPAGTYVEITVAADAVLTDTAPTAVAIERAPAAVAVNAIAEVFQRYEFIGLKNMPLDFQIGTEDVKILRDGIQGKTTKTNVAPQMAVEFLLRGDDRGFWGGGTQEADNVYQSALTNTQFYALNIRLNGQHFMTGKAETTALSLQDQAAQIQKGTATIVWQPTWYTGTIANFQSTAKRDAYDDIRRRWLLSAL